MKEKEIRCQELGVVEDLHPPCGTVKIYVCSTKSDFEWERKKLWADVLWEVEEAAQACGFSVTLVDMYLGAEHDAVYDRHTLDEFLQEIAHAHHESAGPFFLCFLGDKYGPRPLPRMLNADDFYAIKKHAFDAGKDVHLLHEWYVEEKGGDMYMLKHAPYKYKQFGLNSRDGSKTEGDYDVQAWSKDFLLLQNMLNECCHKPAEAKPPSHYPSIPCTSGVEEQVNAALDLNPGGCLVIRRTFHDMNLNDPCSGNFVDLFHKDAKQRLKELFNRLRTELSEENIATYEVPWAATGFDPMKFSEHAQYLHSMGNHIVNWITRKIGGLSHVEGLFVDESRKRLNSELLTHFLYSRQLERYKLHGMDNDLSSLCRTITENSLMPKHHMVLVHGPEGNGKSSFLARWMGKLRVTLGTDLELLVRYVGKDPSSSTPDELLRSLCTQLNAVIERPVCVTALGERELVEEFMSCIPIMASMCHKTFVFVIDGLEKLRASNSSDAYFLDVMAAMLPPNVHLIVSLTTSKTNNHLFYQIRNQIAHEQHLLPIPSLHLEALRAVVHDTLLTPAHQVSAPNQQVTTPDVKALVRAALTPSCGPLFARLLAMEALAGCPEWGLDTEGLSCSLEELVNQRFSTLEELHGEVTVMEICRYITASHYGLTEAEILDLLSCNNAVLQYTYPDDMPSVLRFPYSLWLKIRRDLEVLVEKRVVEGKTLLAWSHTILFNVASARYFTTSEQIKCSHKDIADLFLNTWVGNKPMVLPSRGLQIIDTGSRHVGHQPLLYSETQYNHRRLNELWYHLLHAGDVDRFKQHAFCNFEFLLARIHSRGAHSLLSDFRWVCSQVVDGELQLVLQCLQTALPVVTRDPLQLASQIIGRLRQIKDHYPEHIDTLVQQCMEWCDSYNLPLVVPLSSWLPDPRIPLVATIEEQTGIAVICPTRNNQHVFCATLLHHIHMYHIPTQRLIKSLIGHSSSITCLAMTNSNRSLVSASADCTVRIWDISMGIGTQVIREHNETILCLRVTTNDDIIITGSADHKVRLIAMATGEVLHILNAHKGPVVSVILNNNDTILATGSKNREVMIWDLEDMTLLNTINDDIPAPIISMTLTCDNTFLLLGCEDGSLCVKSFTTGSDIHKLEGHAGTVCSMAVSSDCHHLAAGCSDGNLYLYNIRTRELLDGFSGHAYSITSVCCTSNQHFVITAAKDKINVWTFYRRHSHQVLTDEHTKTVTCVNLSRDGKTAITGSKDHLVRLWFLEELKQPRRERPLSPSSLSDKEDIKCDRQAAVTSETGFMSDPNHHGLDEQEADGRGPSCPPVMRENMAGKESQTIITSALPSPPPADHVYGSDAPRRRSIFNAHSAEEVTKTLKPAPSPSRPEEWPPEGPLMASMVVGDSDYMAGEAPEGVQGANDHVVKLWNMDICDFSSDLVGHVATVTAVALSDDEVFAVSGSEDMTVKVWSITMGCVITDYREHRSRVTSVMVFSDNERIMSVEEKDYMKVWHAETGETSLSLSGPTTLLTLSPNYEYAISGDNKNTMKIWSVEDGQVIKDIAHNETITCVAYSADSQCVVTGSTDMSLKVWQVVSGKLTQVLVGHKDTVSCIAVTDSKHYIISGSHDSTLLIWDSVTGEVENSLQGHTNHVTVVKVSSDGSVAVSGSKDGTLCVWDVGHGSLITTFDLHSSVCDVYMTEKATHLVVRLEESLHVPLLCLHNSPAGEMHAPNPLAAGTPILPLKPQPPLNQKPQSVFPVPASNKVRTSISSIPEIIKVSPIRVPISHTVKSQEKNRETRGLKASAKTNNAPAKDKEEPENKKSGICILL